MTQPRTRTTGRTHTVGHVRLNLTPSTAPLVPAPIVAAQDKVTELTAAQAEAIRAAVDAQQAIEDAHAADAKALADALITGDPDPGQSPATAEAHAARADATRRLAGIERALGLAHHHLFEVLRDTDRSEAVAAIHALAAEAEAAVPGALAAIRSAYGESRSLRALARMLDAFPAVALNPATDGQAFERALALVEQTFGTLSADPAEVTIRDGRVTTPAA